MARERQVTELEGFHSLGELFGGAAECQFVSPWTRAAGNIDARVMVIGLEGARYTEIAQITVRNEVRQLGYNPFDREHIYLDHLLQRYLGRHRSECYLTTVLNHVRPKGVRTIPKRVLVEQARRFTIAEIRIVRPAIAICLGKLVSYGVLRASGRIARSFADVRRRPFRFDETLVWCVSATGFHGLVTRRNGGFRAGRQAIERDWEMIAGSMGNAPLRAAGGVGQARITERVSDQRGTS